MSNLFQNIPLELQSLNQWTVWNYVTIDGKVTKPPKAKVNDKSTWISFSSACELVAKGSAFGIGFIFSEDDLFAGIDLDYSDDPVITARQHKIFTAFDSYSERSPSGQGLHIVVKGKVPSGARRDKIEVYSSLRYFTFTGDVYHNVPIKDQNDLLNSLWAELSNKPSPSTIVQGNSNEKHTDEEIISMARNATNGDKFIQLGDGEWQTLYQSQSEADFALINIVAFYTENKSQIKRIFQSSKLGLRDKAKRNSYVDGMIDRSLDRVVPQIDIDTLPTIIKPKKVEAIKLTNDIPLPRGLLGEIAQYIFASAPRPVPEIALIAAMGLMAGICGRSYNVSGAGLNQYFLLLAETGRGKEQITSGINRLMHVVKQQVPSAMDFIAPSEIASGPALYRHLSTKNSCVSIFSEFGLRLMELNDANSTSPSASLRRAILQLYLKSGRKQFATVYTYSKKEDNIPEIESPAFSIIGEGTPSIFYKTISEELIREGLLPRFMILHYDGIRVPFNEAHDTVEPNNDLITKLVDLCVYSLTMQNSNPRQHIDCKLSPEALAMAKKYNEKCDHAINSAKDNIVAEDLWSRAHLKMLKTAAIIAIGVNPFNPIIEVCDIEWAINLINQGTIDLVTRFEKGVGVNTGEIEQSDLFEKAVKEYFSKGLEYCEKYVNDSSANKAIYNKRLILYTYLYNKLSKLAAFKNDRIGGQNAIKKCIATMIDKGIIEEVPAFQMLKEFGVKPRAFKLSDTSILL